MSFFSKIFKGRDPLLEKMDKLVTQSNSENLQKAYAPYKLKNKLSSDEREYIQSMIDMLEGKKRQLNDSSSLSDVGVEKLKYLVKRYEIYFEDNAEILQLAFYVATKIALGTDSRQEIIESVLNREGNSLSKEEAIEFVDIIYGDEHVYSMIELKRFLLTIQL
jgi:hypothetical protein